MYKYFLFLVLLVFIIGCTEKIEKPVDEGQQIANPASVYCEEKGNKLEIRTNPDGTQTGYCIFEDGTECEEWAYFRGECAKNGGSTECTTDADCVKGGCSGTICQSKDAEPIFTTCEYLPEYECYKQIKCGCIDSKCQWGKTAEFDDCLEKARKSNLDVVM